MLVRIGTVVAALSARHTAARSGYTPAALRALGARWEAYAAWARQQSR
jgi:hypothetical protein